jgi:hypothetical protein
MNFRSLPAQPISFFELYLLFANSEYIILT